MDRRHVSHGRALVSVLCGRLSVCVMLGAIACADPRFARDAGPEAEAEIDAGRASTPDGVDPLKSRWEGRYAVRSFLFAVDGLLRPSAEELSVVEIRAHGDRLMLEQRLCLYEGVVAFVVNGYLRYEFPDDLPPMTAEVLAEGTSFSSDWIDYTLGFEQAPPSECSSADSASRRSEQSWLRGDCECPGPDASTPPAQDSDCRVTDPDHDGRPGATLSLLVSGQEWSYEALQQVRLRYLNGYRGRNGLYAELETRAETSVLRCIETDLTPGCQLRDPTPCAAKYNKTEFVEVGDDYDCTRVVAEKAGLFPNPMPMFPAACAAGE